MLKINKKRFILKGLFLGFFVFLIFFITGKAQAASLYFSPSSGNYNVGDVIKVSVFVDSQNVPVNSVEVNINFPNDLLSVISVAKTNSILTFWVQEPSSSNAAGTVSFSGGLPTPGYNGTSGKVSEISFRVKKAGTASLTFSSGAVRANDGLGTDVLQNRRSAGFTLSPQSEIQKETFFTHTTPTPSAVKINIPSISLKEIPRSDMTLPQARFNVFVKGDLSVIDHFEIQIDDKKTEIWTDDGTHLYETPVLPPGNYSVVAKVYDKAGNFSSSTGTFIIDPLKTPTVTDYPKELLTSDPLTIKGLSYPSSQVEIYLQKDGEDPRVFTADTDQNGVFSFVLNSNLDSGKYEFWVKAFNVRGARSMAGEKDTILVEMLPSVMLGNLKVNLIFILIPFAALFIILILLVLYLGYKFIALKKQNKKENYNVSKDINDTFGLFIGDMRDRVKMLEKARSGRVLTTEEQNIVKQDQTDLSIAESFIKKG